MGPAHLALADIYRANPELATEPDLALRNYVLAADAGEGTDFHAVANGFVSITPLQIDLTHAGQIGTVQDWLIK